MTRNQRFGFGALALLLFTALLFPPTATLAQGPAQSGTDADGARFLKGAIDLHLHVDPRPYGASIDTLRLAHSRGMRGVFLKNHYEPTVDLAYLLRKELPGLQIFGGIDENWISGGFNVAAVEHMIEVETSPGGAGTGIIWLGTYDSEHQVRTNKQNRPFMTVQRNGEVVPEVKKIISLIAKHRFVLATGHNSAEEGLMLMREGRKQGVQHMIFTHPLDAPI